MPSFGNTSKRRLATLHPDLQRVLELAIKDYDFSVICGFRGEDEQEAAFEGGFSNARFGESKHNELPSKAVDIAPYPTLYDIEEEFFFMATHILAAASELKIPLKWGGHWKSFKDLPHFELIG